MQSELQLDGCWELGGRQERAALGGERGPGSEPEGPTLTFSSAASVHQRVNSCRRTPGRGWPWHLLNYKDKGQVISYLFALEEDHVS